jgi:hypothetical protein
VATSQGPVEGLTAQLLIVRATRAVADNDLSAAEDALVRAIALGVVGYTEKQATSALRLIRGEPEPLPSEPREVFVEGFGILTNFAAHLWSYATADGVTVLLDIPDHLPDDPAAAECAPLLRKAAADARAYATIVPQFIGQAIAENAEYLDAPDAAAYRLSTVSLGIGECTIAADGQPDITMTFDDNRAFLGAFLSH